MKPTPIGAVVAAVLLGGALAGLTAGQPALAQESDEEQAQELDRVRVTGSRIRRPQAEGPSPIVVITREDIDRSGFNTVQEAMDNVVQNTAGSVAQAQTFGFTPGASAPRLRGFTSGSTLVLIDGRRPPVYPLAIGAEDTFVDIASIPVSMVERIEVLTDGASAIYGSDAVAGVINIITRKDFEGLEIALRASETQDGGYDTNRVELTAGAVMGGGTSVAVTAEYYDQDMLRYTDRDWANSDIPTGRNPAEIPLAAFSIGGASFVNFDTAEILQAPGCGTDADPIGGLGIPDNAVPIFTANDVWCGFDRSKFRLLFPENKLAALTGHLTHELTPDVEFFGRANFSFREIFNQQEPSFYGSSAVFTPGATDDLALFPSSVTNNGIVPAGAPNNPLGNAGRGIFARRMVEFGPRMNDIETITWGALAGLRGSLNQGFASGWQWEFGVSFNRQDVSSRRPNFILSALENEIVNNGLDLFEPVPQEVIDKIAFTATTDGRSENVTSDISITGDLPFELPGGVLAFAAHLDFERQEFEDIRDPLVIRGDAFDGGTSAAGERDHWGLGVELRIPVIESLEFGLAARFDEYADASQVGNAVSPRFTVAFRPTESLLFRGSAGESFRAPDLVDLFGGSTRGFQTVIDSPACVAQGGTPGDPNGPFVCNTPVQSVLILTQGNPGLTEEEGENFNVGVVWEVIDNLSFSLDYYNIELEGIATTPSEQFILDTCAEEGRLCDKIIRGPSGTLQDGRILQSPANLSRQEIDGVDFSAEYSHDSPVGDFNYSAELAFVNSLETQFDENSEPTENIDFSVLPEWRYNLRADWGLGNHGATLRANYVDELPGINCQPPDGSEECLGSDFVDDYWYFSGQYRYDFGDAGRLTFGINNLFDEEPPADRTSNSSPFVPGIGPNSVGLFYHLQGREYYLRYELGLR